MPGQRFFNDGPVDGSADAPDLLGRQQYARHVVELLHRVHEQSECAVLAHIGPRGSGKSSVLQMTIQPRIPAVVEVAGPYGLSAGVDDDGCHGTVVGGAALVHGCASGIDRLALLRKTWTDLTYGWLLQVRR
ncbi:hypothetical protein [Streptomyces arboris]|uniref:hypothetical protein n=1 Tax=Streptomyces arboris TaxID=2600619 RepID=UPI003BF5BD2C